MYLFLQQYVKNKNKYYKVNKKSTYLSLILFLKQYDTIYSQRCKSHGFSTLNSRTRGLYKIIKLNRRLWLSV